MEGEHQFSQRLGGHIPLRTRHHLSAPAALCSRPRSVLVLVFAFSVCGCLPAL